MRVISLTFLLLSVTILAAQEHFLLVGTYDSPKSEGVYVYSFNSTTGKAQPISHVKTSNPSFVTISPDHRFVYAVNENSDSTGQGGSITAFSFNKETGSLTEINKKSSLGNHPCYADVDKSGKWLAIANYSSGNFSVYGVKNDGSIGDLTDTVQYSSPVTSGTGSKISHVHATVFSPDNKYLVVTDLGLDKVIAYEFDHKNGKVIRQSPYTVYAAPGFGPRHLDFHPSGKYVYVIHEKISIVDVYHYKNGKLSTVESMTSMSKNYSGPAGSADIHVAPDGKFLYVSNRANANDIAIFSIHKKNGALTHIGNQATLGKTPRNFNFDPSGNFLLCGNQNSDEIVIFKRDAQTGMLSDSGNRINVGKPVCIKWITKN